MSLLIKKCAQCGVPSKYCCPKCSTRSCSLACVRFHKKEEKCDGIRDKTAYISLRQFTDINLLSDYRLLEETARVIDVAARDKRKRFWGKYRFLPQWLHRLQVEAKIRGTVLKILPACFTRRKRNQTYFSRSEKTLYWQIEWNFPQADISYTDARISENSPICKVLERYMSPEISTPETKQKLMYYQSAGYSGITLLMKDETCAANFSRYHQLNMKKSFKSNLQRKTIVEFPTIIVVLKNHVDSYPFVIDESNQNEKTNKNSCDSSTEDECVEGSSQITDE